MKKNSLYTKAGYRATLISVNPGKPIHWLFFPGGPGLGSESLGDLGASLHLPGNVWYIDFPNDGSNQFSKVDNFEAWGEGLVDLISAFKNVVLVGHSCGGMFALSQPKIESKLRGMVLINSSPNSHYKEEIPNQAVIFKLPDVSKIQKEYEENPCDDTFKKFVLATAPYFFTEKSIDQGRKLLERLPYSNASYAWAEKFFKPTYEAAFIPKDIPTLIIGSEFDHITPLSLFTERKVWHRENIMIECLQGAGHFSWIEAFEKVNKLLSEYTKKIITDV